MVRQEGGISPNLPEGGAFQGELLTAECSRQEFLKPDAFSDIGAAPHFIADTLRYVAQNSLAKGLAILTDGDGNGFLFKVFKESLVEEPDIFRAEETIRDINLRMNSGAMESVYMEGRTLGELEGEIRQSVSETPGVILVGIFKFTD